VLDPTKLIIIAVVAFLFFGPDKLPEIARTIGRFMREFNKVKDEMETAMNAEIRKIDLTGTGSGAATGAASSTSAVEAEAAPKPAAASMAGHTAAAEWQHEEADEEEEE
jgi:TatA/E family protein of Tat protein translocase